MAKKKYPKKPKAPARSASITQHENYHKRVAEWQKKCAEVDKHNNNLKKAQGKTEKLKNQVQSKRA
ncbi:MAG: hypothetical protein AAFQ92_21445 [Bacteroidota bacterium]